MGFVGQDYLNSYNYQDYVLYTFLSFYNIELKMHFSG